MSYNEEDGIYLLTVQDVQPQDASICILKNGSFIFGTDDPYSFSVCEPCNVTVTYDPITEEVNVVGDGVGQDTEVYLFSVIAAGNGCDEYLHGANRDPYNTSNALTEVSDGVWEMTMKDVSAFDNYHFKFVINSIDEDGNPTANPWRHTFGAADENQCPTGQIINAVYGGEDCVFTVPQDGSTVTLRFDIRRFNFATKKGAKFTITVTPPEPTVEEPILGDVNGDRVVDILDAVLVQKYSADKAELNETQLLVADFNNDNKVDILDAAAIQKAAAET